MALQDNNIKDASQFLNQITKTSKYGSNRSN